MKTKKQNKDIEKHEPKFHVYKTEVEKLINKYQGKINAFDVVREAANIHSPIHDFFDWDDNSASEKWRLHQARLLLNSIKVKIMFEEGEKSYRQYLNVRLPMNEKSKDFKRFYVETNRILENPDLRSQILERAIKEAEYWQRTYNDYQELENIFRSIETTKIKLKKKKILVTN